MYTGLTNGICATAWDITLSSIGAAYHGGCTNKLAGAVVVCFTRNGPDDEFGESTMFMGEIDLEHPDADKYANIANAKAKVSWKTGMSSRKVQQDAPFLFEPGMTKWGGSVVENGLVVAFSGVQAVYDEAIAGTMLRWIVAICQDEMTKPDGIMASGSSFIGEST